MANSGSMFMCVCVCVLVGVHSVYIINEKLILLMAKLLFSQMYRFTVSDYVRQQIKNGNTGTVFGAYMYNV